MAFVVIFQPVFAIDPKAWVCRSHIPAHGPSRPSDGLQLRAGSHIFFQSGEFQTLGRHQDCLHHISLIAVYIDLRDERAIDFHSVNLELPQQIKG